MDKNQSWASLKRIFAVAVGALALLTIGYLLFGAGRFPDLDVFLKAGQRFAQRIMLYQPSDGHYQFKYLPMAAAYFIPLSALPIDVARFVWLVVMAGSLTLILQVSAGLVKSTTHGAQVVILPTILVLGKFYLREIDLGQSNAVMTALLVLMLVQLLREKDLAAGILLAAALTIKPYAAIFLPYFLLKRRWRALFSSLVTVALALVLPALWYGWAGNLELLRQWELSLSHSTPTLLENADNVSLFGFFAKWLGSEHSTLVYSLSLSVGVALCGAVALASLTTPACKLDLRRAKICECGMLLALIPLLTPQGWDYVFLCATLSVMILIAERRRLSPTARRLMILNLVLIGATIYDVVGAAFYRAFMQASVMTVNFTAVVAFLAILRLKKDEPPALRPNSARV